MGNRTTVSTESSNAKRVLLLELQAKTKQEETDETLAAKKRQAKIRRKQEEMGMRILVKELANLEEEKERAKRISEELMETAREEGSRASTSLVCEASTQYPAKAIRLKRYFLGLIRSELMTN